MSTFTASTHIEYHSLLLPPSILQEKKIWIVQCIFVISRLTPKANGHPCNENNGKNNQKCSIGVGSFLFGPSELWIIHKRLAYHRLNKFLFELVEPRGILAEISIELFQNKISRQMIVRSLTGISSIWVIVRHVEFICVEFSRKMIKSMEFRQNCCSNTLLEVSSLKTDKNSLFHQCQEQQQK